MIRFATMMLLLATCVIARADVQRFELRPFNHSPGEDWTTVSDAVYTDAAGFGYESGDRTNSFRFSAKEPEGNYRVTLTLGSTASTQPSAITVKAETRRLMLERVNVSPGQLVTRTFLVNVRTPLIAEGSKVKLTARELGASHWDDKLTLEFLGTAPLVSGIEIERVDHAATIFLVGDSTVTDQPTEPWCGWGQMLPCFVRDDIAVANYAESGRSLTSFAAENRLAKIFSVAKPGDFLFIQFGHNDMKEKGDGMGAFLNYSTNLRTFIAKARATGMTPLLITPMHRRFFDDAGHVKNTFGDYVTAMREVAGEEKVTLIDLNAMSAKFYEALGVDGSTRAFVHYPANTFPDQPTALKDDTHHNAYGA